MITLKNLSQVTAQEVFDQCVNHLLLQNEKSITKGTDKCKYKGPKGLKCAAGCFIAKDEYKRSFENKPWLELINTNQVPSDHGKLILRLQNVHDDYLSEKWVGEFKRVARIFQLEF